MAESEKVSVDFDKCEQHSSAVSKMKAAVDTLYSFRDHYFENHSMEQASKKTSDLAAELQKTLVILEDNKAACEKEDRIQYLLQYGRARNVVSQYDQLAHDSLAKAVKQDFKLADAWNELGYCYWKKGDMDGAKNCFDRALQKGPNKVSLRNLSMVLRQLGETRDEKQKFVLDSITQAKEAVNLDINDGVSWLILANAYLTAFFTVGQNPKLLKQCMAAYQQAEKDPIAQNKSDLHYNHAIAHKYEENYQEALSGFTKAQMLDPEWTEPKQMEQNLLNYLQKVQTLIGNKGELKLKRQNSFVETLKSSTKLLGPYGGGRYSGPGGHSITLKCESLANLRPGINVEVVVLGKVICNIATENPVPFTFCMMDKEYTCFSVTVYNLAQGQGVIIGDSVAIPEPFVQLVDVTHKDIVVGYKNIRVDSPMVLVVNGKKYGVDKHAPSEIGIVRNA